MNSSWNLVASQIVIAYRRGGDRRRICRYTVKVPRAFVGWREGQSFASIPCKLIDLSIQGCQIQAAGRRALRAGQPVWLRPVGTAQDKWIEGTVVAARRALFGGLKVRIRFDIMLSYDMFTHLVYGRAHVLDTPLRDLPEHERDHNIWR